MTQIRLRSSFLETNRSKMLLRMLMLFCLGLVWGCAPPPPKVAAPHEDLDAIAWVQTSAEYAGLAQQTFRTAIDRLEDARKDPKWSAIPSQAKTLSTMPSDAEPLPFAVIVDVDETVLDNSGYNATLVERNATHTSDAWKAWVEAECADAIPGAKTFLDVCRASNVTVFFVTNRENELESATRANLEKCDLILPGDPDLVLSKNEREKWGSNKEPRRQHVANRYRVLLLIGDDFNDFVWAGEHPTSEARRKLAEEHEDFWGQQWFILPNPVYGGWERSLYDFDETQSRGEKLFRKRDRLRTLDELKSEAAESAKEASKEETKKAA